MQELEERLEEIEKQIKELVKEAEELKNSYPDSAMTKARRACEHICRQICLKHGLIKNGTKGETASLERLISLIGEHNLAPRYIRDDMTVVQRKGNTGTHELGKLPASAAIPALSAITNVTDWYFREIGSHYSGPKSDNTDKPKFVKKGRKLIEDPTFRKIAVGTMIGIGGILAGKLFGKKNVS